MSSLRVLHLGTEKSWRGGENQIRLLVEGAKSQGIESHIAYPKSSKAFQKFEAIAPVCALPSRSGIDPRSIITLKKYCTDHNIQILDAHSSAAVSLALKVKGLIPSLKLVVHRRVAFPIKNNFFSRRKYLNPKVDQYVSISQCIAEVLTDAGIEKDKVAVVPSAIDVSTYDRVTAEKSDTLKIGMTSALTDEKGHDTVLRALTKVSEDYKFEIAGDGSQLYALKALTRVLKLDDKVTYLGRLDDIKSFMKSLDIFLMPSRFEGLGTSVLEAMAAGVFVIGSNTGGIPEMVKDGETGLLAEVDDVVDWAEMISKAIKDPELREKCKTVARSHIKKHFSLEAMVSGNVNVYKKLV